MTRCPPGSCRCWAAAPVWSGPRAGSLASSRSAKPIGAGKPARRFPAASSVSVIRVDPTRPPAHQCACVCRPSASRLAARTSGARYEPRRFSGPRKPGADGQCRCGPCTERRESSGDLIPVHQSGRGTRRAGDVSAQPARLKERSGSASGHRRRSSPPGLVFGSFQLRAARRFR